MNNKLLKSSTAIVMSTIISSTPVFAQDSMIVSMSDNEVLSENRTEEKVTSQETLTESSTKEMTSQEFLKLKGSNNVITLDKNITLTDALTINEDCVVDLNGKTLKFTQAGNYLINNANVTFKNGTINFDGVIASGDCILGIGNYSNSANLTLDSVTFEATKYNSAYALIYLYGNSELNINNSTLTAKIDKGTSGGVIKSKDGIEGKININNSELDFSSAGRGFVDGTISIIDSKVTMKALLNGINSSNGGLNLKVNNSTIDITNCVGRALTIDNSKVDIVNKSTLNFSGSLEGDILFRSQGEVNVDEFSKLNFKKVVIKEGVESDLNKLINLKSELYKYKQDEKGNVTKVCIHDIEDGECGICNGIFEVVDGISIAETKVDPENGSSTVVIFVNKEDAVDNLYQNLRDEFKFEKVEGPTSSDGYIIYKIKLNPRVKNNPINYIELKVKQEDEGIIKEIEAILKKDNEESTGGGIITPPQEEVGFKDIKGHWAEAAIKLFKDKAFINGYEDNTFRPNSNMTRAEFIKVVNKVFGYNQTATEDFKDVNQDDWFYKDICIGVKEGYIQGRSKDIFAPNDNITREEAAMILTNIMENKDENLDKLNTFKDAGKTSKWAQSSVEGAIESEYLNGYEDKTIRSNSYITRAEAITMMSRLKK